MAGNYSNGVADSVKEYLDTEKLKYIFDQDNGVFKFGLNLPGKLRNIYYFIGINDNSYIVYAVSPISADRDNSEQMSQLAEFICRANYGLRNGNFELDFRDGELRYKCYIYCNGVMPEMDMIGECIQFSAAMFNHYGNGILQIVFNDMSANQAIKLCEEEKNKILSDETEENSDSDEEPNTCIEEPIEEISGFLRFLQKIQKKTDS